MRKFKTRRPRALSFRSLLVVAGVFLLTAALAPKANAQNVLIYFNFEDATIGGPFDPAADVVGAPDFNPGGGLQASTLTTNLVTTGAVAGTLLNRTAGDIDTANPGVAMGMRTTTGDNGHYVQFGFNATLFSNMSLNFAVDTSGNGFNSVQLSYSITPGHPDPSFVVVGSLPILAAGSFHFLTFSVPSAVNGQPDVALRLTFTGGVSMGNNLETVIDNIQLTGVPEPATVAGGLLGLLGLCWHQRRRLLRCVRLRRT
jgi:PEP-CTERM motif-containing protein